MRRIMRRARGRIAVPAAILAAVASATVAANAAAVTNAYAPHATAPGPGLLSQFAVVAGGSLTALAPSALGSGPQDIAITPDGRFAYVTVGAGNTTGTIARFARGAGGRMEPADTVATTGYNGPRGIVVNPQGTRVFYATEFPTALHSRPISADGTLGAVATTPVPAIDFHQGFLAMTPAGTSLYAGGTDALGDAIIAQLGVDVATGTLTAKTPAVVAWPAGGITTPPDVARMTLTPDGNHLYAASGIASTGSAHYIVDASGALTGGSPVAPFARGELVFALAIAPDLAKLWAPSGLASGGEVSQFSIEPSGALLPLAPAFVPYAPGPELPTRDALAHPDGRSLYLAADGFVGEWTTAPGNTLAARTAHPTGPLSAGLALAPSQAPVASFTVTPRIPGQPTAFDATASFDPDGTVARYDWDFGDGTTLPGGGPTPTHAYATAGPRTATLTVTDADGTSTAKLWTGTQLLRNGGPPAQTARGFTVPAAPPPPPAPDKGKSVTIVATQGKVRVKVPGSKRYVDVSTLREIPLGSRIDARKGRVRITAEVDAKTHRTQSSVFWDGIFVVLQTKGSKPILEARLAGGSFRNCTLRSTPRTIARAAGGPLAEPFAFVAKKRKSKRKVRRLWGRGEGSFRTGGRRSSATVRGTWWLVEDRCDGTLTRVRQGRVDVRDFRLKKTIRLRAGKRSLYLAKAP